MCLVGKHYKVCLYAFAALFPFLNKERKANKLDENV